MPEPQHRIWNAWNTERGFGRRALIAGPFLAWYPSLISITTLVWGGVPGV